MRGSASCRDADGGLGGRSGVGPAGTVPCEAPDMRMRFGPGDEKGFERGSRLLLEQFERWLVDQIGASSGEAAEAVADASVALDWKWGYGDGNLGCWRPRNWPSSCWSGVPAS